jgi:hypothetical protein
MKLMNPPKREIKPFTVVMAIAWLFILVWGAYHFGVIMGEESKVCSYRFEMGPAFPVKDFP